jgi:hypothetical protein
MSNVTNGKQSPAILEVGKHTSKDIRRLKKGEGKLYDKVQSALAQANGSTSPGKEVLPVVILYRQRARRAKKGLAFLGPLF